MYTVEYRPRNLCGVSASAIERPPVDIVDRNHAHVTCLTRARMPTASVLLLGSSCFSAANFGDEITPGDISKAQIFRKPGVNSRLLIGVWLSYCLHIVAACG